LNGTAADGRNDGDTAAILDPLDEVVAVVSSIADDSLGAMSGQQVRRFTHVVSLAGRQSQFDRSALSVDREVNLGA
jgi:hypothetical protein